jgi:hypothetical protein
MMVQSIDRAMQIIQLLVSDQQNVQAETVYTIQKKR